MPKCRKFTQEYRDEAVLMGLVSHHRETLQVIQAVNRLVGILCGCLKRATLRRGHCRERGHPTSSSL